MAAAVALTTSVLNAALLARTRLDEARKAAQFVARSLYHQAGRVIRENPAENLQPALTEDPSVRAFADAVVGYSPVTLYVAIVDSRGRSILHSNPEIEGDLVGPAESMDRFAEKGSLSLLWHLARSDRTLVVDQPFSVDERGPFATVRVAVSTILLRRDVLDDITTNAVMAAGVVIVVFGASFYFANRLLAPVEMLRRELARIDTGQNGPPLDFRGADDVGRLAEFFATVTERLKEGERSTGARRDWMAAMVGGLCEAVLVLGQEGRILVLNDAASNLIGAERADLAGRLLVDVLPADDPLSALVSEVLELEEGAASRQITLDVDGREVRHMVEAHVLREGGTVTGVMITVRDLDELSRLASQLSYSQKLAALGQLTSGVAHEIKNPLNALVMHTALLRRRTGQRDHEAQRYLDVMDEEIRRLDRVIQGFLKFSRPEELKLETVELGQLLAATADQVRSGAQRIGIRLDLDLPDRLPPVSGNGDLLRQAFQNLLTNSIEAMPDGGELQVRAKRNGGMIRVDVQDTGAGIAEESLSRVFHLFYTTKEQGSGIGLALVYRIVQLHGGSVHVESTQGEGTTVTVSLPEAPA